MDKIVMSMQTVYLIFHHSGKVNEWLKYFVPFISLISMSIEGKRTGTAALEKFFIFLRRLAFSNRLAFSKQPVLN